ncbi:MAG: site-specific integrase [Rikenellaceae bacterium]|nr:site-specific integrase [Rikenellaceae bacterium]
MKRNSFGFVFFIKKTKLLKNGEAPIRLRITVNGYSVESQIKRSVIPEEWIKRTEQCKGRDRKSIETNEYIRSLKLKILSIHRELEMAGAHFTSRLIMDKLYGAEEKRTILAIFRKHNDDIRKLIGIDYEKRTVSRYDSCCNYLEEVIKTEYGKDDLSLNELNGELIRKYEMYLKLVRGCQQNTVIRYIKCFKKVVNMAIANEWLAKDPFYGIRFTAKEVNKDVLTKDELDVLINYKFQVERLEHVRDVFIFCCFTGLAYIDAHNLRPEDIYKDKKEMWITKTRQKTNIEFRVPLLHVPMDILNKYKDHPLCLRTGLLLPITSNQKMNDYIKEAAALCGIKKHLTTHTARRTYATTVCHENGVALENISKMLGHTDTRMTLHYTKISNSRISQDMEQVRAVFDSQDQKKAI